MCLSHILVGSMLELGTAGPRGTGDGAAASIAAQWPAGRSVGRRSAGSDSRRPPVT